MRIRDATEEDAAVIAGLSAELDYPADVTSMRDRIRVISRSPSDLLRVAVDESDRPIGCIQVRTATYLESGLRAHIVALVVTAQHRRSGIGQVLVRNAEEWAIERGAEAVVVRSNITRHESHLFYPTLGYERLKTQHVYAKNLPSYFGTNEKK